MQAKEFIEKWNKGGAANKLNERAGAQPHFIDLCRLLGVPEPADPDNYCFERGLIKTGSTSARTDGYADVWRRGAFAWEYKAPGRNLQDALAQLMRYTLPLENPPLLVVSDRLVIEVHTHFTGTPSECHPFAIEDLADAAIRQRLRALWDDPESFRPKRTNRDITEAAASTFAGMAQRMRGAGAPAAEVSHFLTQCVFCFFAEDVKLLPERLFERLVQAGSTPEVLRERLSHLFETMKTGGFFGVDTVHWFNGGLFQEVAVPPLDAADFAALRSASALDWSSIDPSILGTLFERGLDPAKRSQLGAHYTDPTTILRLVEPVVQRPLLAEWTSIKERIEALMAKSKKHGDKAYKDAHAAFVGFLECLRNYQVLDPACGSGNFLYLALKCLKDIEHQVNIEAEALGLERQHDVTGPHNVRGIELNEYAAELARATVWIGELQWRLQKGLGFRLDPVLQPLDHIECRDALIDPQGNEASWPEADAVVGNPPFVGDKKMRSELGSEYTLRLRSIFDGRVPGGADLVCYWFEKARAQIEAGQLRRAGLVSTNSIRGGRNREVLDRIVNSARIFEAWSDEPWVNNGAALRVSLVAFGAHADTATLDGIPVDGVNADLTPTGVADRRIDLTRATALPENRNTSYLGIQKTGPFEIPGGLARQWLQRPNPNGRPNSDVVRPWFNGLDLTRRNRDMWIVDFGAERTADDAALYEAPFAHVDQNVRPTRVGKREARTNECWWLFQWSRPLMRQAMRGLPRAIATPEVSKHRLFAWLPAAVIADKNLSLVARADDTTFGILHSRLHEAWSLRMCTWMGKGNDPRYTPTTCFETFPFPAGLTPADTLHQRVESLNDAAVIPAGLADETRQHASAIARAAHKLNTLRSNWLNPPEWTQRVPEVIPLGMEQSPYPDRILPKPGHEKDLAKRTLTNLYNERPAWLANAHTALDAAVAAAYGWTDWKPEMADDEILRRLLQLNSERAAAQRGAK